MGSLLVGPVEFSVARGHSGVADFVSARLESDKPRVREKLLNAMRHEPQRNR